MTPLGENYKHALDQIKVAIQASEHLANYLEEEEDEHYESLKTEFESQIEELHRSVAFYDPLQQEAFESELLDPDFEGLFLPRVLGYSVLRGALNDQYRYIRPQEHFKNILLAISNSSNFDILKNRIGQTIEVGFALSSDIWITNLINEVGNKQVRTFLEDLKDSKYNDIRSRRTAHVKYMKQFRSFNYLTAELPQSSAQVKIDHRSIISFLLYRGNMEGTTSESVYDYIHGFIHHETLGQSPEHLEILLIIGFFFDLKPEDQKILAARLNTYQSDEEQEMFGVIQKMQLQGYGLKDANYDRFDEVSQQTEHEALKTFTDTCNAINEIGYINPEAVEVAKSFYDDNKGTSLDNECLRNFIFSKIEAFMTAIATADFQEYFEMNKTFVQYMNVFENEKFNQNIKGVSLAYIKKLIRVNTDKRSKDYQDIKKFAVATFVDLGFMKDKQIKELFKTKRKKKVVES